MTFGAFIGIMSFFTTLVAGDLVKWAWPSITHHVVLLAHSHRCVVLRSLTRTGAGELDEREGRAADCWHRLCLVLCLLRQRRLFRRSHRQLKPRMHKFTGFPFWTETDQVVDTNHPPGVPMSAVRTMFTESAVVPRAVFNL